VNTFSQDSVANIIAKHGEIQTQKLMDTLNTIFGDGNWDKEKLASYLKNIANAKKVDGNCFWVLK